MQLVDSIGLIEGKYGICESGCIVDDLIFVLPLPPRIINFFLSSPHTRLEIVQSEHASRHLHNGVCVALLVRGGGNG